MKPIFDDPKKMTDLIQKTAIAVFIEKGYSNAKMQEIANAAGLSRGPLYYYYTSKLKLYLASLERCIQQEKLRYREIFQGKGSILEKIYSDLQYCTLDLKENRQNLLVLRPDMPQEGRELVSNFYKWVYDLKINAVEQAITRGEISQEIASKKIVNNMFITYEGLRALIQERDMPMSADEIDEIIESCISLIRWRYCPNEPFL